MRYDHRVHAPTSTRPRLALLLSCALTLVGTELRAQAATVHGRVVSEADEPVQGALVTARGTPTTVSTDVKGEFEIVVPDLNATLVVRRVGFARREVPLNGQTEIVIRLTATAVTLDATVVVGYGTQRRTDVTGAVTSLSPERLENTPNTSVAQVLQGAAAGVSVTTSSSGAEPDGLSIIVRGQNSITARNTPLIVVDGMPYYGGLSEINQADVAAIQILKDASAAAIYGSRGSNGVILITTKRGGTGKPRVSYEGYTGVQGIAHLPALMTGPEFEQFKCDRINGGQNCDAVFTATELANASAGRWTDWVGLATRRGVQQQHTLSVSGGTEDTKYYVGGSLLDVQGVAKNDQFRRYSARLNLIQRMQSWLELGTSTQLSVADRDGLGANFSAAFLMNPLTNAYAPDGSLTIRPWPEDPFFTNPLQGLVVADDDIDRRVFTSNYLEAKLPFLPGLSYRLNAGIDFVAREQGRYYGRNTAVGLSSLGSATTTSTTRFDWTVENIVRYTRVFGRHGIDVTALYSAERNNLDTQGLHGEGFPNDVLTYHQMNVAKLLQPSENVTRSAMISQMGRLNYNYADRYLVTLTARRDGASVFGANHKYGIFPSLAFAWNLSSEPFWHVGDAVSALKLRVSYGENGNQAIAPNRTLSHLTEDSYLNGEQTAAGYRPATLGNPDLRWEATTSLNVGTDFALLNRRLQGSLDVYRARTWDLLLNRAISPVHGITSITQNIGKTQNTGIELQLTSLNIDREDFSWTTDFNISANRNKIVDLYGNQQSDVLNEWFIGRPIVVNYGYAFCGIWQEGDDIANSAQPTAQPGDVRVCDQNGDGQITPDDRGIIGSLQPSYSAGLSNTFRYKHLTLKLFFHTVQGVTRANSLLSSNVVFPEVRRNTLALDYWTPENPINTYPANREGANPLGVAFYEDASFIRLKDVTLAYDAPPSLAARAGAESLRLYVTGTNLLTATDWRGLDPELSDQRAIPLPRVITGGINVQF